MRRLPGRRTLRVASLVVVCLAGAVGGAFAFWTSHGTGTSTATAAEPQLIVLSPGVPTAALYPGGEADVALVVSNPNVFPGHIAVLALDPSEGTGGFGVDAAHVACGVSSLSFSPQTNSGAGWTVPARTGSVNGSLALDIAGALKMSAAAASSCQGANFTIFLNAGL